MWNRKKSVTLSIIVCFGFLTILTVALFLGPWAVEQWFILYRGWIANDTALLNMLTLFKICFYPSAVFIYIAIYSLLKLLYNIKKDDIFIPQNVTLLRVLSWCCFVVAVIIFIAGIFYIPYLAIAAAAAFIGLMLRIVKNVMQAAVEIKSENELTI